MANLTDTRYLDYAGLQTLVAQIKAADTVVKNFAGNIDGKVDSHGQAYTSVQAYLEDEIAKAAASGSAKNVSIEDTAGYFEATNVEAALAELAVEVEKIEGDATTEGSFAKAIKDAIGELKIGDITYSTVKAYVDALNTAVLKLIHGETGSLNDLTTTNKTNLVAAINEVDAAVKAVDYSGKADKVASATAGNFAGLDENGNLIDSGKKAADFDVAGAAANVLGTASDAATANTVYGAKAAAKAAQDDVNALETTVGDMTAVKTDAKTVAGAVDELKDAIDNIDVSGDIQAEINKLDATVTNAVTEGTQPDVVVTVKETDGKLTSVTAAVTANRFDAYGAAAAVQGDTTKTVKDVADEIDGLGTAAQANVATVAIGTASEVKTALPTVGQVETYVTAQIADLEGAMHFAGVITRQGEETDLEAIARVITEPKAGDTVVMADNANEYIYAGTEWRIIGQEGMYVQKTTTIAGVDLQDSITKEELQTALELDTAAYKKVEDFDAAGAADAVLGKSTDTADKATVYGAKAAIAALETKVGKLIFVGTQEEYNAAIAAGTIDENTFAVITDAESDNLVPIESQEIINMFK